MSIFVLISRNEFCQSGKNKLVEKMFMRLMFEDSDKKSCGVLFSLV